MGKLVNGKARTSCIPSSFTSNCIKCKEKKYKTLAINVFADNHTKLTLIQLQYIERHYRSQYSCLSVSCLNRASNSVVRLLLGIQIHFMADEEICSNLTRFMPGTFGKIMLFYIAFIHSELHIFMPSLSSQYFVLHTIPTLRPETRRYKSAAQITTQYSEYYHELFQIDSSVGISLSLRVNGRKSYRNIIRGQSNQLIALVTDVDIATCG